jgi:AHBA synthesis associated protein
MAPLRAAVFDLDGVLIDSLDTMRLAFQAAYAEVVADGPAPFAVYLSHLGRHMPDILEIMQLPAAVYPAFVRHSSALIHRVPASPGAARLLDELRRADIRLAVATGKTRDRAEQVLDAVGLLDRLDVVCGSDEVVHGKPAPDIVRLALERLGVGAEEAVMIGDSVLDLLSGQAAGTRTVAALWGQGSSEELLACGPDLLAASCDQLREQLDATISVRI